MQQLLCGSNGSAHASTRYNTAWVQSGQFSQLSQHIHRTRDIGVDEFPATTQSALAHHAHSRMQAVVGTITHPFLVRFLSFITLSRSLSLFLSYALLLSLTLSPSLILARSVFALSSTHSTHTL